MSLAPIALFVYARPEHTRRTLESLAKNELAAESVLHVFCDGPRNEEASTRTEETFQVVDAAKGFKDVVVIRSEQNRGLANSVIQGVTTLLHDHPSVIVVEDDLVSARGFLTYMNEGLERYKAEPQVFTICGYSHPPSLVKVPSDYPYDAYFSYRNMSWGWATWPDRWAKADWGVSDFGSFEADATAQARFNRGGPDMSQMLADQMAGKMDSWAIRWSYTQFKHNGLALLPVHSFIHNIGADSTGTHFGSSSDKYDVDLSLARPIVRWPEKPFVDERIAKAFAGAYKRSWKRGLKKALGLLGGKR